MDKSMRIAKLEAILIPLLDVIIGFSSLASLLYGDTSPDRTDYTRTLRSFQSVCQYAGMADARLFGSCRHVFPGNCIHPPCTGNPGSTDKCKRYCFCHDFRHLHGDIRFNHLTFAHLGNTSPVLHDINLDIPSGTTLAIIGRTGNGKSTLVNLLLRLYNTEPGMIYLDDHDINTIPLKTLRENIAYVPQDNFLFFRYSESKYCIRHKVTGYEPYYRRSKISLHSR